MEAQLGNFKEKGRQMAAAMKDLKNKADAMNDMVAGKGDEIREIQIVNDQMAKGGQKVEGEIDQLKEEQQQLLDQFEQEKEKLFDIKEIKEELEG